MIMITLTNNYFEILYYQKLSRSNFELIIIIQIQILIQTIKSNKDCRGMSRTETKVENFGPHQIKKFLYKFLAKLNKLFKIYYYFIIINQKKIYI